MAIFFISPVYYQELGKVNLKKLLLYLLFNSSKIIISIYAKGALPAPPAAKYLPAIIHPVFNKH